MRPVDLIGQTIVNVTEQEYVGKDGSKTWLSWTQTTLHLADGSTHSYTDDTTDVYYANAVEEVTAVELALDDIYRDDNGVWCVLLDRQVLEHGTVLIDGEEYDPTYKFDRRSHDV